MSSPPESAEVTSEFPSSDRIRNSDHQIRMIYHLERASIISEDWHEKATAIFKQGNDTNLSKAINELLPYGKEVVMAVAGGIIIEKTIPYVGIENVFVEGKGHVIYSISLPMEDHDDYLKLANTKDFIKRFQSESISADKHVQEKGGNEAVDAEILEMVKNISITLIDSFTCKTEIPPLSFNYSMESSKQGKLVIFNQVNFSGESQLGERIGSNKDENSLKITFEQLGFEVESYKDQTKKEVLDKIAELSKQDYSEHNCFACAVLTHGGENGTLWASDEKYDINGVVKPFASCSSLIGKPKLFFIQACRGIKGDPGVQKDAKGYTPENFKMTIPIEADFLISYSSTEGYASYRSPMDGSWYIQNLTECLEKYKALELTQILTLVTKKVCKETLPVEKHKEEKHQVPCFVSRLTGFFYFYGKKFIVIPEKTEPKTPKTLEELETEFDEKKLEEAQRAIELGELQKRIFNMKLGRRTLPAQE